MFQKISFVFLMALIFVPAITQANFVGCKGGKILTLVENDDSTVEFERDNSQLWFSLSTKALEGDVVEENFITFTPEGEDELKVDTEAKTVRFLESRKSKAYKYNSNDQIWGVVWEKVNIYEVIPQDQSVIEKIVVQILQDLSSDGFKNPSTVSQVYFKKTKESDDSENPVSYESWCRKKQDQY